MKTFVAFLFLFVGAISLQAKHHGETANLPACCSDGCCCTGADTCTGCACTKDSAIAEGNKTDDYPLKTCVVSGETLGSMGDPVNYWHKVAGQPDRLVKFCCSMCEGRFESDPAKYLAKIDSAKEACCESKSCCDDGACSDCESGTCTKECCDGGNCDACTAA